MAMGDRKMTLNSLHKNQAGFTLFEMIIVIFLFAILLIGLLNIFDWQQKVYNMEQAEVLATGSARNVMNNMNMYIAQADQIEASRTINGVLYTTGGTTIVVRLPSFDASGDLLASTYDYFVFTQNGTNLNQVVELAANSGRKAGNKLLSDKVDSFALTYNNGTVTAASKVTVNLTTKAYFRGTQFADATLAQTIFLRNK